MNAAMSDGSDADAASLRAEALAAAGEVVAAVTRAKKAHDALRSRARDGAEHLSGSLGNFRLMELETLAGIHRAELEACQHTGTKEG
jgi:hypothetical protein